MESSMSEIRDINAAFEAWLDATEPATPPREDAADLRYRRYGQTVAALECESDYLVLCRIETDPAHRGQGSATALLDLLKALCDRYHVTLLGQAASHTDEGLDQQALLDWYARHGFTIDRERTAQPLVWYPERP
ncbi:N-acetyltransferase [Spiribacter halobius]|uniref:N-acetyltransferase n=2 Tax=Sediminicurvatus halobius TaxID=2182432 RepID=A0A2U2N0D4_9GAMM|nr:N-acetyltransferase [Spiribacter halobius]